MKLYFSPTSPYSRKVLVALHEKQIDLEREALHAFDRDQMARLRSETGQPLAQLPLLHVGEGRYLRESALIVEYLDRMHPGDADLVPRDSDASIAVRAIDRLADTLVGSSSYLVFALRKPPEARSEKKIASKREAYWMAVRAIADILGQGRFFHGDRFTLADIAMLAAFGDLPFWSPGTDLRRYPNLAKWHVSMQERASWRRVIDESEPFLADLPPLDSLSALP